jgi:hypothetical protein
MVSHEHIKALARQINAALDRHRSGEGEAEPQNLKLAWPRNR